jgi:hypothetical protein
LNRVNDVLLFDILKLESPDLQREEVLAREAHWKKVLLTRVHGYNGN